MNKFLNDKTYFEIIDINHLDYPAYMIFFFNVLIWT